MFEKYADQIVGAVLAGSGAVLTTALAWAYKRANEWWRRPRVAITFGNGEGHIYENVLIKSFSSGGSITSTGRDVVFVRVKVSNVEAAYRTPEKARGCVGYLAGLEKWNAELAAFEPTVYQDFLRLEWSFNREAVGMDLLSGIPVWLDVCYLRLPKEQAVLKIASNPPVNRYEGGFKIPGAYRVKVQVSGDNVRAVIAQFYVLVSTGSSRPEVLDESAWTARCQELTVAKPNSEVADAVPQKPVSSETAPQ